MNYIAGIKAFAVPDNEKWVISFGLYGDKKKYTIGALRNALLAKVYFPGWECRFYAFNISSHSREALLQEGAVVIDVNEANMLSRYISLY